MTSALTIQSLSPDVTAALTQLLLRFADDRLVLGHRLSEWCGHGPILEEDIALTNVALDLIGAANSALSLAGTLEGKGRDADALAYLRNPEQFCNLQLVEQPNGDFGVTIMRQFLFDVYSNLLLAELQKSPLVELSGIAAKTLKEDNYHLRHSASWIVRLGDGTAESKQRVQDAADELWRFTREPFESDETITTLQQAGIIPSLSGLRAGWEKQVAEIFAQATLTVPKDTGFMASGGRLGKHSEHLSHMLAEMQVLPRSFPGATW